jgi:small subunit ribosomal protein S9
MLVRNLASMRPPNSNNNNRRRRQQPSYDTTNAEQRPSKLAFRTHAVNLFEGDYSYDDDDDVSKQSSTTTTTTTTAPDKFQRDMEELVRWAKQEQEQYEERRKKWMELSKAPERRSIIDDRGRSYGRGGRKKASARVWIQPGMGEVVVNRNKSLLQYFPREAHREMILSPLVATGTCGVMDVQAYVQGGGLSGQAGAIRHGLARALNHYNPDLYRPPLKRLGYLTRDPRKVERKKVGKVKARKSPQWVRR